MAQGVHGPGVVVRYEVANRIETDLRAKSQAHGTTSARASPMIADLGHLESLAVAFYLLSARFARRARQSRRFGSVVDEN